MSTILSELYAEGGLPVLSLHLTVFTLGYMLYLFSDRCRVLQAFALRLGDTPGSWEGKGSEAGREWLVYLQKSIGFLLLGPLPFALLGLSGRPFTGLALPQGPGVLWWSIPPLAVTLILMWLAPRKNVRIDFYPQVRRRRWDRRRILLNAFFWTIYLIGYEYIFRGYLLFPLVPVIGTTSAVALNAGVYALAHIYKGPGEAFGAFFLGILLCVIALETQSFIIPALMHIILAVGNDLRAVAENPEMTFGKTEG